VEVPVLEAWAMVAMVQEVAEILAVATEIASAVPAAVVFDGLFQLLHAPNDQALRSRNRSHRRCRCHQRRKQKEVAPQQ